MKKLILLLFVLLLSGPAYSWQQVVIEEQFEENQNRGQVRNSALESGFREAVSLEVQRIVPGISEDRQSALLDHIDGHVGPLVQGYRQASWKENDSVLILEMEVNIDTDSLRSLLQKTGVYYTSESLWPYDFNTRGASPADFSLLQKLQLITGTVVDGSAATILSLAKTADGLWNGSIIHDNISRSASGNDLDQVWFDLWEYFFSRPEIKSSFTQSLVLTTSGWSATDAIMNFDRMLETWDREIEHKNIISVYSGVHSLKASWQIRSLSPELLLERLENYLSAREIDYNTEH